MKVLLIIPIGFTKQNIVDSLTHMLRECGCEYHVSTVVSSGVYDLILALNKESLNQAGIFAKKHDIPLAYLFTASTIELDYPEDYNSASVFFVVEDFYYPISKTLCPPFIKDIRLNYSAQQSDSFIQHSELRQKVLIALDSKLLNYQTFLKILPTINLFTRFEFTIINIPASLADLLNPHVKLSPIIDDTSLYHQSDFIVGSGCYVHKAITYQKPCIIVGDRGYGGILDVENFEIQHQHFFQGRAGAELDEHIPPEFLRADLVFLQEFGATLRDSCSELLKKITTIENENIKYFKTRLSQVQYQYYQVNHSLQELRLKLTNAFNFVPTNEEYLMVKTESKVLYSKIDKEEMAIINSFADSCTCDEAFERFNNKSYDKGEFIDFVRELLDEKVLQVNDE